MYQSKSSAFVVAINAVVLLALLALVAFIPPMVIDFCRFFASHVTSASDPRSALPNYTSQLWAKKHFEEFTRMRSKYYDYIVWRRDAFVGATIHVDGRGYRRHAWKANADFPWSQAWFFGGSTMWGYGSRDFETIPADVQRISGLRTFNFAEAGYVSHQSLNLLQKAYLEGGHPKYVVFYDGVNEAAEKCMVNQSVYATTYELAIRSYVDRNSRQEGGSLLLRTFTPTVEAFWIASARIARPAAKKDRGRDDTSFYECQEKPQKVHAIAAALVADWAAAKALVESNGGTFIPILQPVAYVGAPNLTHLQHIIPYMGGHLMSVAHDVVLQKQYELVYAEIRRVLAEQHFRYIDLTGAFDGKDLYYIDECHVSPNGNELIAKRLSTILH